jgi:Cu2+-exporting ATPase
MPPLDHPGHVSDQPPEQAPSHQPSALHSHGTDPDAARLMEHDVRRRFWVALALTIPVAALAGHVPGIGMPVHQPLAGWLGLALSAPVVWWSGWMFIAGSVHAIRRGALDMNVLIATGVLAAWLSSVYLTLAGAATAFFEAAVMLVTFVLFGHWMEMKSRRGTSDALRALFALVPPTALVVRGGIEVYVATAEVVVGDLVRLRPGDKVPVDGEITEGATSADEALITGESQPLPRRPGDALVGGSFNISGAVTMRATRVGRDTVLAQIGALVERAQQSKAPGQRLADRAAAVLVVVAVGAGVVTFAWWSLGAGAPFAIALTFAISTVVVACPDALGLATPTAVAVGTGVAARHNILIKDAATLEGVSRTRVLVLDKTGTLTVGKPTVTDVVTAPGVSRSQLLARAAAVAARSTHPLSQAIVRAAASDGTPPDGAAEQIDNVPGMGVTAVIRGEPTLLGSAALLDREDIDLGTMRAAADALAKDGRSLTFVAAAGSVLGVLGITDAIRATSAQAIRELKGLGVTPVLLSGDVRATAARVAAEVGIGEFYAGVRPEDKAGFVKRLQENGWFTAMVGDGVNDAPALAQADVGIAIGAGTDVAIQAAQVVLMKSDPLDIVRAIRLSRATVRTMRQNLAWASVYNLLAIPIAAGIFYPSFGLRLRPEVSALLMSASSILVALNAVLLRRVRI